jgi:hypothetical protein
MKRKNINIKKNKIFDKGFMHRECLSTVKGIIL